MGIGGARYINIMSKAYGNRPVILKSKTNINNTPTQCDMKVSELLSALDKSAEFKKWREANPKDYLAHVFCMIETEEPSGYDIGFFDPKEQKMCSFTIDEALSNVMFAGESEVFKRPEDAVKALDPSKVRIEAEQALETASKVQAEKYPKDKPFKKVVILQNIDEGQVWNITYITQTFKTLNMKIDAASGEVLDDRIVDLVQMGK